MSDLEDPLVEAYRRKLAEAEPIQQETPAETRLRLAAAVDEIRKLRRRVVDLVSERAALRGERDTLKKRIALSDADSEELRAERDEIARDGNRRIFELKKERDQLEAERTDLRLAVWGLLDHVRNPAIEAADWAASLVGAVWNKAVRDWRAKPEG